MAAAVAVVVAAVVVLLLLSLQLLFSTVLCKSEGNNYECLAIGNDLQAVNSGDNMKKKHFYSFPN